MKVDIQGTERYIDGLLQKNLEIIRRAVEKKWDGVFFVGGYEGDGKSVFAAQLAAYYDRSYCLERCVFTPQQFLDAVNNASKGQAIVYDEAQDAFESTNRDKMTKAVKSALTRIRRKQLYIIIVAPDFWRVNKYLFIHRSRAFIRVYADGLERGRFEYYNRERKHQLMIKGKREEKLCVPPNFRGRFTKWFPLNEAEYDAKKEAADVGRQKPEEALKPSEMKRLKAELGRSLWDSLRKKGLLVPHARLTVLADIIGCSERMLNNYSPTRNKKDSKGEGGSFEAHTRGESINNNLPSLPIPKGVEE